MGEQRLLKRTLEEAMGDVERLVERVEAARFDEGPVTVLAGRIRELLDGLEVRDVERRIGMARDRMVRATSELVMLTAGRRKQAK